MTVVDVDVRGSDFAGLCRQVRATGLLDRRYGYYAARVGLLLAALAAEIAAVVVIGDSWYQALSAVTLGLVLTQIAFVGHDAGHQQIFRRRRLNDATGVVAGNLLVGLSYGWWVDEHTRHHTHPNHEEHDPDIAESVLAFTRGQAAERSGALRFIAKHEARLFFPLLTLEGWNLHVSAAQHLLGGRGVRYPRAEKALLAVHLVALVALPMLVMSPVKAVVFILISQAVFGVYMGCSFAPNHKGMPTVREGNGLDFLRRQVLTSRNIRGGPFVDVLLGGLNYQIEHHLFPSMPSSALRAAKPIVERYCAEIGVLYTETSLLESYRIALRHLHDVGTPIRDVQVEVLEPEAELVSAGPDSGRR
ncbi:fatty acid desaturase family protein [uncultured Jatrophihabitans sp.]|uniref:fatty acid desaturase family protein n=1 Tax=uncultured Jatrophihabitans sp. TaxID=1610747 RepID=UPI0035CBB575